VGAGAAGFTFYRYSLRVRSISTEVKYIFESLSQRKAISCYYEMLQTELLISMLLFYVLLLYLETLQMYHGHATMLPQLIPLKLYLECNIMFVRLMKLHYIDWF
jgi:hypothetical protein